MNKLYRVNRYIKYLRAEKYILDFFKFDGFPFRGRLGY